MSKLNILVVIPCLNEAAHIGKLLDQLISESPQLIVVADGGSTDETVDIVNRYCESYSNIKLIKNNKKIQSAGINLAVEKFGDGFKYFVRIDAHGEYPSDFLDTLYKDALVTKADSVVVSMDTYGERGFQKAAAYAQNSKLGNGGSSHRNDSSEGRWVDHGHHALMSIKAFHDVNGYDESFVANEDAELDFRLSSAGYKIWLSGKTNMKYFPRDSFKRLFVQYYRYGIGRASNALKHKQIPKVRQLIPLSVFPCLLLCLLAPISSVFLIPFIVWFSVCVFYGVFIAVKSCSVTVLLSGFIAATMHFGWSVGFCKKLVTYPFTTTEGAS
ncbi:glycosyltransferase family 2 protein [Pseudoalteromonas sp. TAE56]|uniref:glycosyltransferase family 2 protein n=1 Tax=Pseudoalteromonas sp. TAE56 TaxID=1938596 RepID=UPI0004123C80|nr:glycosyltransferase family 2 protein [Pseudoalteromonas sp. TAE56]